MRMCVVCVLNFYHGKLLPFYREEALCFLGVFIDLQNVTASFVMSDHTHGTVQLPLDKFS
jgi:hypothetical protein